MTGQFTILVYDLNHASLCSPISLSPMFLHSACPVFRNFAIVDDGIDSIDSADPFTPRSIYYFIIFPI